MKPKERKLLARLEAACRTMGGQLDYTATTGKKLVDRQLAHKKVAIVLYGVLTQSAENEHAEEDWEQAEIAMKEIEEIVKKQY